MLSTEARDAETFERGSSMTVASNPDAASFSEPARRIALPVSGSDGPAIAVVVPAPCPALRFGGHPRLGVACNTGLPFKVGIENLRPGMVAIDIALPKSASIAINEIRERAGIFVVAFPAPTAGRSGAIIFHLHATERPFHLGLIDHVIHYIQTVRMGVVHLHIAHRPHGAETNRWLGWNGRDPADERAVGVTASARKSGRQAQDQLTIHVECLSFRRCADPSDQEEENEE